MPHVCFVYNFCLEGDNFKKNLFLVIFLALVTYSLTIADDQNMFIKSENEKTIREKAKSNDNVLDRFKDFHLNKFYIYYHFW